MKRNLNPEQIKEKSFRIIEKHMPQLNFSYDEKQIAKRTIHATADFSFARSLLFHKQAVKSGLRAIRAGKNIIVDVNMVKSGVDESVAKCFGCRVKCFINNKRVIHSARRLGVTKAVMAMRKAIPLMNNGIVVIGNAPTALFELCDLVKNHKTKPALIVGIPVGFVGAQEAKKELLTLNIPYITNRGRKGGSSVACAIVNALLKIAESEVKNE